MYAKKTPKTQEPDKSWYTLHHCHDTTDPIIWYNRIDYYDVLSIDPGRRNFCMRIERRNLITKKIVPLAYEKVDLIGKDVEDSVMAVDSIYKRLNNLLDKYLTLIKNCHIAIIERQLQINYKMVRLSQHIITYLTIHLKNLQHFPVILEVSPRLKTRELQAPKGISDKEIKKWAISESLRLLEMRNDKFSIDMIQKAPKSKKDDLADVVVQIEAIFSLIGLPLTELVRETINIDMNNLDLARAPARATQVLSQGDLKKTTIPIYMNNLTQASAQDNLTQASAQDNLTQASAQDNLTQASAQDNLKNQTPKINIDMSNIMQRLAQGKIIK